MISILILLVLFVLGHLVAAWGMALLAKWAGSPRGRFGVGLLIVLGIIALHLAILTIGLASQLAPPELVRGVGVVVLILQIGATFAVVAVGFSLSFKRALVPFAGYVGMGLAQIAIVLLLVRPFLIESLVIPSSGMAPTLDVGSRFVVNKRLEPRRFDLVVFWNNADPPTLYCQRLIGLPGESLRTENGELFINGERIDVPEVLVDRITLATPRSPFAQVFYAEGEAITLRSDEFFFIGDNVDASADSRMHGPTQREAIVGVVDWIYWPWSAARILR